MSNNDNGTKEIFNILGQIIAIIMIVRYALLIVEHYVQFLPTEGFIADAISFVGTYAPMALMVFVGLEAVWDKSFVVKLVFLIVCAAIIIFTFLPGVRATIENYIGLKAAT